MIFLSYYQSVNKKEHFEINALLRGKSFRNFVRFSLIYSNPVLESSLSVNTETLQITFQRRKIVESSQ
jgi:hypothetical protein